MNATRFVNTGERTRSTAFTPYPIPTPKQFLLLQQKQPKRITIDSISKRNQTIQFMPAGLSHTRPEFKPKLA